MLAAKILARTVAEIAAGDAAEPEVRGTHAWR